MGFMFLFFQEGCLNHLSHQKVLETAYFSCPLFLMQEKKWTLGLCLCCFSLSHLLFWSQDLIQVAFWLEWPMSVLFNPFQKQQCCLWLGASGRGVGAWGLAQATGRTGWTLQRTYPATAPPGTTAASEAQQKNTDLFPLLILQVASVLEKPGAKSTGGLDRALLRVQRWHGGLNVPTFSPILSSLHVSFYCFWKYSSCFLLVVLMSNI